MIIKDMKTLIISVACSLIAGTGTWIFTSDSRLAIVETKVGNMEKGMERVESKIDRLLITLATDE